MQRIAIATWKGGPRAGEGSITTASHVIEHAPYAFTSGAHNDACTSPCEMLAAAHASCLSLAVASELTRLGHIPQSVTTEAIYTMDLLNNHWTIMAAHLDVTVRGDIEEKPLQLLVEGADTMCPISRALHPDIKVSRSTHAEAAFALDHA